MARNLHAQYAHQYSFPKVSQQVTNTSVVEAAALEGGRIAQLFCGEQPKLITDMSEQELDEILDNGDVHSFDRFLEYVTSTNHFDAGEDLSIDHFERRRGMTPRGEMAFRNGKPITDSTYGGGMIEDYDPFFDEGYSYSDIYNLGQARGCVIDGVDIELLFDRQGVFHDVLTAKLIIAKQVAHNTQPPTDPVDLLTNHGPMRLRDKELFIQEGDHNAGAKPEEITRKARRAARRLLDQLNKN